MAEPQDSEASPNANLRSLSLNSAIRLAAREAGGIVIRLVGVVVVTKLIGPADYGIYSGCAVFVALLAVMSQQGVEAYLVTRAIEPSNDEYHDAITFLLITSITSVVIGLAGSYVVEATMGDKSFLLPFRILLFSIPINILWAPAQAKIERAFRFRRMAFLEIAGDCVLYGVAVPLAFLGAGAWSLVAGFIAWQAFLLVGSYWLAHMVPRLRWTRQGIGAVFKYTASYSASMGVANALTLVSPIIIGAHLGAAAVGVVALAQRLVETVSFVVRATWRLSMAAIGRVQNEPERLRNGVEEGMALQALFLGPIYGGLAVISSFLVLHAWGPKWVGAVDLIPYLTLTALLGTVFLIPIAMLRAKGKGGAIFLTQSMQFVLTLGVATLLVPHLGITGYGIACLFGLLGYIPLDIGARRIVPYTYSAVVPWLAVFAPVLIFQDVPLVYRPFLFIPLAISFVVPHTRHLIRDYALEVVKALGLWSPESIS